MALTRVVNGQEVPLTKKEEDAVLAERAAEEVKYEAEREAHNDKIAELQKLSASIEGKELGKLDEMERASLFDMMVIKMGAADSDKIIKPYDKW